MEKLMKYGKLDDNARIVAYNAAKRRVRESMDYYIGQELKEMEKEGILWNKNGTYFRPE